MAKYLFVCGWGEVRSPTAYDMYKNKIDCWYAGMNFIDGFPNFLDGFDCIIVFKDWMQETIKKQSKKERLIYNLDINDIFGERNHKKLIDIIRTKINQIIPGGLEWQNQS